MNISFPAEKVRVYFNRASDAPKVWSIDFGPGTAEICCNGVTIRGHGLALYEPGAGDRKGPHGEDLHEPRAWFEFQHVQVEIVGHYVKLTHASHAS